MKIIIDLFLPIYAISMNVMTREVFLCGIDIEKIIIA